MRHPGYPICALLGLLAVLLPSPWHWRARNISTLGLIFWLSITNLTIIINSLLWADNIVDRSPVWCDICEHSRKIFAFGFCLLTLIHSQPVGSSLLHRWLYLLPPSHKCADWNPLHQQDISLRLATRGCVEPPWTLPYALDYLLSNSLCAISLKVTVTTLSNISVVKYPPTCLGPMSSSHPSFLLC